MECRFSFRLPERNSAGLEGPGKETLGVHPVQCQRNWRIVCFLLLSPLNPFLIFLSLSRYAKYYFELRDLAEKDSKRFPLLPLDKQGIERLEVCGLFPFPFFYSSYSPECSSLQQARANYLEQSVKKTKVKTDGMVRSSSSDNLPVRSPKVILS